MKTTLKSTFTAPSNIAFVKYWGAQDLQRAVPRNPSISMTLDRCLSRCTAEWRPGASTHEIRWQTSEGGFEEAPPSFAGRVRQHLDNLRRWSGEDGAFQIATANNFPSAAGIASSASGFAALTLAATAALGLRPGEDELSRLAQMSGSGSASRSVMGGYVEWPVVESDGAAQQLATADHWPLRNVIAVVDDEPKKVSSLEGHQRAPTSPFYERRQEQLPKKLAAVRTAIAERDLRALGEIVEAEAIELHCIAMTSSPPIYYWRPGTLAVLEAVRAVRAAGHGAYATMDAGPNVHVICAPESEDAVAEALDRSGVARQVIHDRIGAGPRQEDEHFF